MRLFSIFILTLVSFSSVASDKYKGYLVLNNNDTLTGELSVNLAANSVIVTQNNTSLSFHASKIKKAFLHLSDHSTVSFVALANERTREWQLFEQVVNGSLTLLRRYEYYNGIAEYLLPVWYAYTDKELQRMNRFKKDFLKLTDPYSSEIKAYCKKEDLNWRQAEDFPEIVNYYNSLTSTSASR
jgi:hypothetical protein